MTEELRMWTVYDHPRDCPFLYVARMFIVKDGTYEATANHIAMPHLDKLRMRLQEMGLVPLCRHPSDPPEVVETWI